MKPYKSLESMLKIWLDAKEPLDKAIEEREQVLFQLKKAKAFESNEWRELKTLQEAIRLVSSLIVDTDIRSGYKGCEKK